MKYIRRICCALWICLTANIPFLYHDNIFFMLLLVFGFILLNIIPAFSHRKISGRRLRICADGCELLVCFLLSVSVSAVGLAIMLPVCFPQDKLLWFADLACVIAVEAAVFFSGIIRVYLTSSQIGVKWRTIGILCAWIPIVNLAVLLKIIRMAAAEWEFESGKIMQAQERKDERLCETRYPILMVHGVFFISCLFFPMLGVFKADSPAWIGVAVLEFWCIYFCPIGILSCLHFINLRE